MARRFQVGEGVVFPIFVWLEGGKEVRGRMAETKALGVVTEVLTEGGRSYNIRDLATGRIHGVIHKHVREPDLLTRLAIAASDPKDL